MTNTSIAADNLINAAMNANLNEVARLLREGVDPNVLGSQGETALHCAALIGHAAIAQELLAAGARTDTLDKNGRNAMQLAREYGRVGVVEVLSPAAGLAERRSSFVDRASTTEPKIHR